MVIKKVTKSISIDSDVSAKATEIIIEKFGTGKFSFYIEMMLKKLIEEKGGN